MKKYRIIDAHCHIYPDKIAQKAANSTGVFYDIPMCLDGKISTLLTYGEKAGIEHFLVQSVATTPKQVSRINNFIEDILHPNDKGFDCYAKNLINAIKNLNVI